MTHKEYKDAVFSEVFNRENGKCFYCERTVIRNTSGCSHNFPETATLDHLIPRSKGGVFSVKNLVLACYGCNSERGNKKDFHFLKEKIKAGAIK